MGRACCFRIGASLAVGLAGLVWLGEARAQTAAVLVEREKIVEAQKRGAAWKDAPLGLELAVRDKVRTGEYSRAAVRFLDLSMIRLGELNETEIIASPGGGKTIELKRGGLYFFSRERPEQIKIRTAAVNGALRGTEFALRVAAGGRTTLAMFEGEVELSNPQGRLLVRSGEAAEVEIGGAPRRTAVIEAESLIQWCLYYPAVIDPASLGTRGAALEAYAAGDLPGALEALPQGEVSAVARAAVILSSGQVERARAELRRVPRTDPQRRALERMIAAVQGRDASALGAPVIASEWLAESYACQARHDLDGARDAARRATELSPQFGFAWARLGELEFSFGRIRPAMQMAERALELSPRHAQAHALQGFLLAAENRHGAARRCFDAAIALDPALGHAWLGRGLIAIRQGDDLAGRHDLQTAAILEPRRSVLRSYLGKALSQTGHALPANAELARAAEIDPADPTPPLYTAVQRAQENRYNEAIAELERSLALNDHRRVYRSRFLLDQDRAIRSANLAAMYENAGLGAQALREAGRAVDANYASAPAHLFLANSFNNLRDPTRILLRYEPAWFNELLLANLLSPVGGGPLSQFVSEMEYSKFFEADGLGMNSLTEYRSDGQFRALASQFGTAGNLSYALDAEYFDDDGARGNNAVSRFEAYATFKLQLGLQDTLFFQTKYQDFSSGYLFQLYDPREAERLPVTGGSRKNVNAQSFDFREKQEPGLLLGGWRHDWAPRHHTLLLLGRLASDDAARARDAQVPYLTLDANPLVPPDTGAEVDDETIPRDEAFFRWMRRLQRRAGLGASESALFDLESSQRFTTWHGELQHVLTLGPTTFILGGRYQRGEFEAEARLSDFDNGESSVAEAAFEEAEIRQRASVDFERVTLYAYQQWRPARWLSLTAGVSYDSLDFPVNTTSPPISDEQRGLDAVSPKVGAIVQPWSGAVLRAAYAEGLGGASFDESVRLEPTQVAGFLQSYRSLISESLIGSVSGSEFRSAGVSLEQRLPTRTYLGVEWRSLRQDLERTRGAIDSLSDDDFPLANFPSTLREEDSYREDTWTATLHQLLGDRWSAGAEYRYTRATLRQLWAGHQDALEARLKIDDIVSAGQAQLQTLAEAGDQRAEADLQHLRLFAIYNHPSGFFAGAEAHWYKQDLARPVKTLEFVPISTFEAKFAGARLRDLAPPGDDFWQFHVSAGWRFLDNRCEIRAGVLNLTDEDYRLAPLTPYAELPRERTFFVRCRLSF
jgi:tetratricopeptide (TPR) repeat protein